MGNVRKWGKINSLHETRSSRQCVQSATSFLSGIVFNIILIAYGDTWNQEVRSFSPDDIAGKQLGVSQSRSEIFQLRIDFICTWCQWPFILQLTHSLWVHYFSHGCDKIPTKAVRGRRVCFGSSLRAQLIILAEILFHCFVSSELEKSR